MNIEILKIIKKQNEFLVNKLSNNNCDKNNYSEKYLYENCLSGNRRRCLNELNQALTNNQ